MAEKAIPASVQEFELLKKTFKGNNDLLVNIRTLLLGFDISDGYKKIIKTIFSDPFVFKAFRKKMFAIYSEDVPEAPIESISDIWTNSTQKISGATPEQIKQEIQMRKRTMELLKEGIETLRNPDGDRVNTNYTGDESDEWGIELLARNYYVGSIQQGISQLSIMVNVDTPTAAQVSKKAKKDSVE